MTSDVRTAIDAVNRQFVQGAGSGNVEAMAAVYTEDAMILPPGTPTIQGRAAIQEFWAGAAAALGVTAVDLSTQVLEVQDDTAREIGHFTIHGAEGVLDQGKYIVVWKNTNDGWRWHWDIWNSNSG